MIPAVLFPNGGWKPESPSADLPCTICAREVDYRAPVEEAPIAIVVRGITGV